MSIIFERCVSGAEGLFGCCQRIVPRERFDDTAPERQRERLLLVWSARARSVRRLLVEGLAVPDASSKELRPFRHFDIRIDLLRKQPPKGGMVTVTRDGERLLAQLTGQPQTEVFPESETSFFYQRARPPNAKPPALCGWTSTVGMSIVLYNSAARWTAPDELAALDPGRSARLHGISRRHMSRESIRSKPRYEGQHSREVVRTRQEAILAGLALVSLGLEGRVVTGQDYRRAGAPLAGWRRSLAIGNWGLIRYANSS